MAWLSIFIAGILEVGWAFSLKHSHGFSQFWPSVLTLGLMFASFFMLAHGMKTLPLGTSYAVWTGIGAVGSALVGIVFLNESASLFRVISISLIVIGIIGLKLAH